MAKLNMKLFGLNVSAEVSKPKTSNEVSREMADSIKKACIEEIRKHKRQGGLLHA